MEIHEWIVARRILIALWRRSRRSLGLLRVVRSTDARVSAGRALAGRIVPHVFAVGSPRQSPGRKLVGDIVDRRRVYAALTHGLAVCSDAFAHELDILLAIALCRGIRRLTADQGDVIVEADMPDTEVVLEVGALRDKRLREVRRWR